MQIQTDITLLPPPHIFYTKGLFSKDQFVGSKKKMTAIHGSLYKSKILLTFKVPQEPCSLKLTCFTVYPHSGSLE